MKIRVFNNTDQETNDLVEDYRHLFLELNTDLIESISFDKDKITIFGIECVLGEFSYNENREVSAVIRWFDKVSGEGCARLPSGKSLPVYACNIVGANSYYPFLVTNISLNQGDKITAEIPADVGMLRACGLIKIKKLKE